MSANFNLLYSMTQCSNSTFSQFKGKDSCSVESKT